MSGKRTKANKDTTQPDQRAIGIGAHAVAITVRCDDEEETVVNVHRASNAMRSAPIRIQALARLRNLHRLIRSTRVPGRPMHFGLRRGVMIFVGFLVLVGMLTTGILSHRPVTAAGLTNHRHDKPIIISFARPVRDSITYSWVEKIAGTWHKQKGWGGVTALVFTPKGVLPPGATLHAQLSEVKPVLDIASETPASQTVSVTVQRAPGLDGLMPGNDATGVQVNSAFTLQLSAPNRKLRQLELKGDIPVLARTPVSSDDLVFRWTLAKQLEQGKTYTAEVIDRNQPIAKQHFATFRFTTVSEPQPRSDTSQRIHPGDTITIEFDAAMEQSQDAISFAMPGTGAWTSGTTYRFKVGDVKPGKTYTYTVGKDTKSRAGGFTTANKTFQVSTPGQVTVVAAQPTGTRAALNAPIKLTFDQPVDRASAQAAFSVNPAVQGTMTWSGNTLTFTPVGYSYQTTYTYSIGPGIVPVFGLPGVAYSNRFTSAYEIKKLNVPYFRQAYSLSCEAASLRMALAYYGVATNDDEILSRIGYAPQPRDTATNTWQDPNVEFVGDVNGKLNVTGWGVYAGPVASAARSFGRGADVIYGPSVSTVASAIHAGRPVVVWGVMGMSAVNDSWNTTTSGVVYAAKNQHVRLAYGVEGSASDPVGFYVYDPLRGSVYVSSDALQASMNGGGRQVLVVQ
ncbi:Ig-like domain-containing protein [Candidatus Saccharibacteria bacterium]|nr:Ig-like domain-containing protein [Candidatus Saccharibacteria bacterium]